MAFSLATLTSEINTDPTGLGYAPLKAAGNDVALANLLNALTATNVFRNDIRAIEVINAIVAADFAGLTQIQISKLSLMLAQGTLDATNVNVRTIFLGIFSGLTNTVAALTALAQRPGTRAEVLFGTGTVVTPQQVGAAR